MSRFLVGLVLEAVILFILGQSLLVGGVLTGERAQMLLPLIVGAIAVAAACFTKRDAEVDQGGEIGRDILRGLERLIVAMVILGVCEGVFSVLWTGATRGQANVPSSGGGLGVAVMVLIQIVIFIAAYLPFTARYDRMRSRVMAHFRQTSKGPAQ